MDDSRRQTPVLRKTRIVCISDTHNQTPKLPKGDVLIHAGDLTNQGSYSELKKTVEWLEKADFEAKIVVAGNHDITLDAAFYGEHGSSWKWPKPQDPEECLKLLKDSKNITYLQNEAASVYLRSPTGPQTCFRVFGSPCTPKKGNWAFQYETKKEASRVWDAIPLDTDIVVTHTPPKGHCDAVKEDDRSGCEVLLKALDRVRPMLSVFGHIHGGRGAQRVVWNTGSPGDDRLEDEVEIWKDPGIGNSKQSLVNLTGKGGRRLNNSGVLTRCSNNLSLASDALNDGSGGQSKILEALQSDTLKPTSGLQGATESEAEKEAVVLEDAFSHRQAATLSDIGSTALSDVERRHIRRETVMINAAFLGPRMEGRPMHFNKPIVVDIDLPVWTSTFHEHDNCKHPSV